MSMRLSPLLALAVMTLPLPAYADCAARIAAIEEKASVGGAASGASGADSSSGGSAGGGTLTGEGQTIREDGGQTTHAEGGPATPNESWFSGSTLESEALTHLDAARNAKGQGNEQACLDAVEQAEAALSDQQ